MRIKKYQSPAGALNKRYTDKDFEGTGWHYIPRSDIKPDDKLLGTAQKQGEEYYLAGEDGYLLPSNIVNHFLKNKGLTTAYDYYYDQQNLSPFTKNLNKYFTQQYDANDRIGQQMRLRAADRKANRLTPGAGTFVVAPVTATLTGVGGATLAPWLTSALATPTGQALMYGSLGGEALNFTSQLGDYDNFGHLIYNAGGGQDWSKLPEWQKTLWNFTNPGYMISGPTSKAIDLAKEGLERAALQNVPTKVTTKDLAKAMKQELKHAQSNEIFPGTIGWAPHQTLTGYHASYDPDLQFDYNFLNWAEKTHDAPKGIYFTANQKVPSGGHLAKRPYVYQVETTLDRPMVQVGDIPITAKNATRNEIERMAMDRGADGIIYDGIADNQLKNQQIVKTLNPNQEVQITGMIDRQNPIVNRIESNGKIRFQLDSHTPERKREFVLEPQGDNKFRIHMRTWDGEKVPANMTDAEKNALFEAVYNELPEGAEILFPESSELYPATRGTVAGLIRLSRDPRFTRGQQGILYYTDKDGSLQTFTGAGAIKRSNLQPYPAAGQHGEYYPKLETEDSSYILDEFNNMYSTPLELYTVPVNRNLDDGTVAQGIGQFDLSNGVKDFTNVMRRRWNQYNYKFSDNDITPISDSNFLSYVQGDGNRTFHTIDWIFDNIKNKKQILYTPTTDHSWGGFHVRDDNSNWIRWNPRISHIPTTIHETISHGTDPIVRNFITDTGQPVLGKSTVSTLQWNPETGNFETMPIEIPSLYEQLSYPIDVFNPGKVADTITGDALKDHEARASNWEMIANLYNRIAKERGITPQEAFQIPDSEFHSYVDNLSNKDIIDLLKTTNGYTMKYAKLLDTDDQWAVNNYLRLWRKALKYAPSLIPVGLSQLNQPTSNRKGGKLIPRKFQFKGNR